MVTLRVLPAVLAICFLTGAAPPQGDAEKQIGDALRKMRSLPDADRAKATKETALQIRSLAPGARKVGLASSLANLSTEGDFGRDTLQAVTDTLVAALNEAPPAGEAAGSVYFQVAQLARYEGMRVSLKAPGYQEAQVRLAKLENQRAAVDFTLQDLQGKSWKLSDLKGKVVLVNFWATWCPPCRKEMPDIEALFEQFKDKGLVVLAISDEDEKTVRPFVEKNGYRYPMLLDPGRTVNTMYAVDGIPKTFIYNRAGKLVAQSIDMRTRRQFLELLAKAGMK